MHKTIYYFFKKYFYFFYKYVQSFYEKNFYQKYSEQEIIDIILEYSKIIREYNN